MSESDEQITEASFFKQEVEAIIKRYGNLSVYATLGALEVIKANLLDRLLKAGEKEDE